MNAAMMFVRALNSRRLAQIVLVFLAVRRAMEVKEICLWTDLSPEYANLGLQELKDLGVIVVQILAHNRKMWIPGADLLVPFTDEETRQLSRKVITGSFNDDDDDIKVVLSSNSSLTSSSESQLSRKVITGKLEELSESQRACLKFLKELGVGNKRAAAIVRNEWVTIEYIQAHKAWVDSENWDNPIGMMITRIENEQSAPTIVKKQDTPKAPFFELNQLDHDDTCECVSCKRSHPERFCIARDDVSWSGKCGELVAPGSCYCERHKAEYDLCGE